MKKLLFLITSIFLTSFLVAQENKGYAIKMKIKPLKDTVCYLGHYYGDKQYITDTAKVDGNGTMVFDGKEKLPGGMYLLILPNKRFFEILIDKEQHFSLETDTVEMIKNMKIKGSSDNELFYSYLAFIAEKAKKAEPLRKLLDSLKNKDSINLIIEQLTGIDKEVKEYKLGFIQKNPQTLLSAIFKASQDPEIPKAPILPNGRTDSTFQYYYYKNHYFDNIDLSDDRLLRTPIFHNKLKFYLDKLVLQMPDSIVKEADLLIKKTNKNKETFKYIVYYVTYNYESSQYMGMDAVFVHMGNKYYRTGQAYWVDSTKLSKILDRVDILEPLLIGKTAPKVIFGDTAAKQKKYYNLHEIKSKYTILVFWDPDCGHCKKEIPKIKTFYDKYKLKGFEVMAVNIEDKRDPWINYIKEHKLNFINVSNSDHWYNLKKTYDVYSTPVIYVLDENKKIIAKRIGAEQLEDFAERLLKQLK